MPTEPISDVHGYGLAAARERRKTHEIGLIPNAIQLAALLRKSFYFKSLRELARK